MASRGRHCTTLMYSKQNPHPPSLNNKMSAMQSTFTWWKTSLTKFTLSLVDSRMVCTMSYTWRCSSSMLHKLESLGRRSDSVLLLEWLFSGSPAGPVVSPSDVLSLSFSWLLPPAVTVWAPHRHSGQSF